MHHLGFFLFVAFVCFVCFNDFLKYVYLSQIDLRDQHSWLRKVCLQGRAQPEGLQNSHFWEEKSPHRDKQCCIKTLPLPTYQQHYPLPSCLSLVWNQPLPFLFFFFFLFLPLTQMQSENNCGRGGFLQGQDVWFKRGIWAPISGMEEMGSLQASNRLAPNPETVLPCLSLSLLSLLCPLTPSISFTSCMPAVRSQGTCSGIIPPSRAQPTAATQKHCTLDTRPSQFQCHPYTQNQ